MSRGSLGRIDLGRDDRFCEIPRSALPANEPTRWLETDSVVTGPTVQRSFQRSRRPRSPAVLNLIEAEVTHTRERETGPLGKCRFSPIRSLPGSLIRFFLFFSRVISTEFHNGKSSPSTLACTGAISLDRVQSDSNTIESAVRNSRVLNRTEFQGNFHHPQDVCELPARRSSELRAEKVDHAHRACPQPQYRFAFRYLLVTRSFPARFGRRRVPTTRTVRGSPEHHRVSSPETVSTVLKHQREF